MAKYISEFEVALMKCPNCADERKIAVPKTEQTRHTYCMNCGQAVYWARVEADALTQTEPLPAHPGCCDICDTGGCCKEESEEA